MPEKEYMLVFAPPGVGLDSAVNKLQVKSKAEIADIEKEIKENPKVEEALKSIGAYYTTPINMETVTQNLPRLEVAKFWKDAVKRCLNTLRHSDKSLKILSGHITYYSAKRSEFYSVIDPALIRNSYIKPTSLVLLIDDIYDMYIRLSKRGKIFSNDQIKSYLKSLERRKNLKMSCLSNEEISFYCTGWKIKTLLDLFSWRRVETIMAQNLAYQLDVRFMIWATKQLINPLKLWFENPKTISTYISHPIRDPRKEKDNLGHWPEFTQEVNQLQKMFCEKGIALVMPTGIDELRFQERDQRCIGYLKDRWPLISKENEEFLYLSPIKPSDVNYSNFLFPKYWDFKKRKFLSIDKEKMSEKLKNEINAFLQILVREIESQIASRDFLIIYHTNGLLVYRPYYAVTPREIFSGGVKAEVELWEDIVQLGEKRSIVFIHFKKDIEDFFKIKEKKDILRDISHVMHDILESEGCHVPPIEFIREIIEKGETDIREDILDKGSIAQKDYDDITKKISTNINLVKNIVFKKYLYGWLDVDEKLVEIWIFNNFDELRDKISDITLFLKNGTSHGNWEEKIETLSSEVFK